MPRHPLVLELDKALKEEARVYIEARKGRRSADGKPPSVEDAKMLTRLFLSELKPPVRDPEVIRWELRLLARDE